MRSLALLSLLVTLLPPAAAQAVSTGPGTPFRRSGWSEVTVFLGPDGGFGDLAAHDPRLGFELARPRLEQVQLLPFDAAGRSELWSLRLDVPRHRDDVAGAGRLVLPGGNGVLYHYRRQVPAGLRYGFLLLRPDRPWRRLGERAGTGPAQDVDPYLPRVAVDAGGRAIALLTTPAAGGDLFEIDLVTGARHLRSADLPPLDLSANSLLLGDGFGFVVGGNQAWRFARTAGGQLEPVAYSGAAPAEQSGEAVISFNRRFVLFTAGAGPQALLPWVLGASGPAEAASDVPQGISPAGYLPEWTAGPYLAVSDDGAMASWRNRDPITLKNELMLTRVAAQAQPVQVSSDDHFIDTLDQVGAIGFYRPDELTMAMGAASLDVPGAIENVDLYRVTLGAADQPVFDNLTFTSGDTVQPYVGGTIDPIGLHLFEDGSFWFHDDDGAHLMTVQANGVLTVAVPGVKSVEWIERVGADHLAFELRREAQPRPHELWAGRIDTPALTALDLGTEFTTYPARGVAEGTTLAVLRREGLGLSQGIVRRFDLALGTQQLFPQGPAAFDGPLSLDALGKVRFRLGGQTGPAVHYGWSPAGTFSLLDTPALPGQVLPAR